MPCARHSHIAVIFEEALYIFGGVSNSKGQQLMFNDLHKFSFGNDFHKIWQSHSFPSSWWHVGEDWVQGCSSIAAMGIHIFVHHVLIEIGSFTRRTLD